MMHSFSPSSLQAISSTTAVQAGLTLLSYVGNHAFFASLPVEGVDAAALSAVPALAGMQGIERAWKLDPRILADYVPDWAVVSETPTGARTVGIYVVFHPDGRAEAVTINFPDGTPAGRDVVMWGFALDSSFGAGDGTATVPGPTLVVPPGDTSLMIHVDNNLSVPVSIVIPGQITPMTPVIQSVAPSDPASIYNGRVRSFTHETRSGTIAPVTYTWANFRPGPFISRSTAGKMNRRAGNSIFTAAA